nr:ScpA family protein [Pseudovibrio hongkongensis]
MAEEQTIAHEPNADVTVAVQVARGAGSDEPRLEVDLDGFEGPLDLLLTLARAQKVDLTKISILQLVEQYLGFVQEARRLRLELAADYLVMAAWLAYLKSRLLIPKQEESEELSGEEMAAALAFRLQRLEAMREAAARLMARPRLGREVFARGAPEDFSVVRRSTWRASLFDLLTAYASQRQRNSVVSHHVQKRQVWSLAEARQLLERLIGEVHGWMALEPYLLRYVVEPEHRASALASSFTASLELVREGRAQIQQAEAFAPIYIRGTAQSAAADGAMPDDAGQHQFEEVD